MPTCRCITIERSRIMIEAEIAAKNKGYIFLSQPIGQNDIDYFNNYPSFLRTTNHHHLLEIRDTAIHGAVLLDLAIGIYPELTNNYNGVLTQELLEKIEHKILGDGTILIFNDYESYIQGGKKSLTVVLPYSVETVSLEQILIFEEKIQKYFEYDEILIVGSITKELQLLLQDNINVNSYENKENQTKYNMMLLQAFIQQVKQQYQQQINPKKRT